VRRFTGRVTDVRRLTADIFSVWLKEPVLARAVQPGQFVNVQIGDGVEFLLRRPISVADVSGDRLRLVFRVVGRGTAGLSQVRPGAQLDLLGPLGRPVRVGTSQDVLVCGGGVGAAPLLFLSRRLVRNNRLVVVLGARSKADLILVREFRALGVKGYLATDDGSLGWQGTAAELAEQVAREMNRPVVYACGPKALLADLIRRLPRHKLWGFVEERLGCGTGICHCCALPKQDGGYLRLCQEGPVVLLNKVRL